MILRKMKILDLVPTDIPNKSNTLNFLNSLTPEEIINLKPTPQVWLFDGRHLLTDGHNRTLTLAKRGIREFEVDYNVFQEIFKPSFQIYLEDLNSSANYLKEKGITSLYDFL